MDIRKADSKGRLTGFLPGYIYAVRSTLNRTEARVLDTLDEILHPDEMNLPPEAARLYLNKLGIPTMDLSREGITKEGYSEVVRDETGAKIYDYGLVRTVRKPWPGGFDWEKFLSLVTTPDNKAS